MVKLKTINLNSVRLNTVALNHYGNISGGGSKSDPIAVWIRKHMAFRYDTKGYTNEALSQTKQLEDLSGNNRPMLLNNFLFAGMSGVGGYNSNFSKWRYTTTMGTVDRISSEQIIIRSVVISGGGLFYYPLGNGHLFLKCNITGITEELKGKIVLRYPSKENYFKNKVLDNGYFEFDSDIETNNSAEGWVGFTATGPIDNCNITITQIPEYPGALVTDGVDDYGAVQNMPRGVKMLFMTVNPIGDNLSKVYYDQRRLETNFTFEIIASGIAYNNGNVGGKTYINGKLNTTIQSTDLFNVKHNITIVNDNVLQEDFAQTQSIKYFMSMNEKSHCKLAFYNSIGFDSIPTEEDGFTEQELIDYVIEKYELNKI